jgi:hypothetical protein
LLLEPEEVNALVDCMAALDESQAAEVAVLWLQDQMASTESEPHALANVAMRAARIDPEAVTAMVADLEQRWLEARVDEAGDLRAIEAIAETYFAVGDPDKGREWIMRAYAALVGSEESRASVEVDQLASLAGLMQRHGLTGRGTGYAAFASALVVKACEDGLKSNWFRMQSLASLLCTVEARETLRDGLLDPAGSPRSGIAQLLSWAHRYQEDVHTWNEFLEGKVEQASGDAKALWLLARAYSESTVIAEPNPLAGQTWLNQALAASNTDSVRLLVLGELARGYVAIQKPEMAIDLLESATGQMSSEEGRGELEALQVRMETAAARAEIERTRDLAHRAARSKAVWRAELERRLERARAEGNDEAIARYSGLLEQR